MTDTELADEIERQLRLRNDESVSMRPEQWQQIIAALRRQPSGDQVLVPRERLRKLIEWQQREQDELTCSDLCDKTYEFQGCPSGTCALQSGKDELAWWAALAAAEADGRKT